MDTISDNLGGYGFSLKDSYQRSRCAMVNRGHCVEQMRYMREAGVESIESLLVSSVRVAEGGDNIRVNERADDSQAVRQFRCDRHHTEMAVCDTLDFVENLLGWQADTFRQYHPFFFKRDKRAFEMDTEQICPAEVPAGLFGGEHIITGDAGIYVADLGDDAIFYEDRSGLFIFRGVE